MVARRAFGATLGQAITWCADAHETEAKVQRAAGRPDLAELHEAAARLARVMRALGAPVEVPAPAPTLDGEQLAALTDSPIATASTAGTVDAAGSNP